jgi:hypothetical protein
LPPADKEALLAFEQKTGRLLRAVLGANAAAKEAAKRIDYIKTTIEHTPSLDQTVWQQARNLELRLMDLREQLAGDRTRERRNEPDMPGIIQRIDQIVEGHWGSTSAPTGTQMKLYDIAANEFTEIHDDLKALIETDLVALESTLEEHGAPWTPGRGVPDWHKE